MRRALTLSLLVLGTLSYHALVTPATRASETTSAKATGDTPGGATATSAPAPARRIPDYVQGCPALAHIDSVWTTGDKRVAHAALDTLIVSTRASGDRRTLALALVLSGAQLVFFGDLRAAQPRLDEGVALAREVGDSSALLSGVHRQAIISERLGRVKQSDSLYVEMLELARACKDARREGWALIGIGWSQQRARKFQEACDKYREAIRLLEREEDWEGYLWALNNLCTAQQSSGAYQDAIVTANRVIAMSRERAMPLVEAMALSNLGGLEYALGDPGLALQHFEQAYALHTKMGAAWEAIVPAINVALCRGALGQYGPAQAMLDECLQTAVARGYLDRQGMVLTHLARLSLRRQQPHEAARYYRRVLALGDTLGARTLIEARTGLAQALSLVDSLDAAVSVLEVASAAMRDSQERDQRVLLEIDLSKLYLDQGRPARALEHLASTLELARAQGRQREQLLTLILTAKAQRGLGQFARAHEMLVAGVGVWETNRQLPFDPRWREERANLGQQLYTDLASLILEHAPDLDITDPAREAFDLLQPYKARTLLERMAGPGTERALVQAADTLGFANLAALQLAVLSPDEVFLDAYLGIETSVLFAVTTDSCRAVRLPSAKELGPLLSGYRELLATPPTETQRDLDALDRVAAKMADRLFGGVGDLMAGRRRILIAPDGALNLLPFMELPMNAASATSEARAVSGGPDDQARAWIETAAWERVPSATILMRLRYMRKGNAADGGLRVLALAGEGVTAQRAGGTAESQAPSQATERVVGRDSLVSERALPGSIHEVRALGRRYRDVEARVLSASRDTLTAAILDGPDVIHIASHLTIDDENPWQSAIRLGVETVPPNLTAGQIAQLRLPARLAVLAGCESAAGRVVSGEGVLGTASAFLSAGVPAVVATLWPVGDQATAALMLEFYKAMAGGCTTSAALHRAQLTLRADPATRHPFFWAGFVLIGDGDVRAPLDRRMPLLLWLLPVVLVGLGATALAVRRWSRDRRAS